MSTALSGKNVAFVVANEGIEQAELAEPWKAVTEAGATATLIAPKAGHVQAFNHLDPADTFPVDVVTADADAARYDALMLPGGVSNADQIRADGPAVAFVKSFVERDAPIGVICHGGWILIEAEGLKGRTLTSWPSLQTDLRNAGATWVDEEVHVDANMVSSRKPDDLPAFCDALIEKIGSESSAR